GRAVLDRIAPVGGQGLPDRKLGPGERFRGEAFDRIAIDRLDCGLGAHETPWNPFLNDRARGRKSGLKISGIALPARIFLPTLLHGGLPLRGAPNPKYRRVAYVSA